MVRSVHQIAKMSHRQSARSACGGGSILHRKLELVCGAKWKRPVKRVYGTGRKGNGAICAPNRQNESSPIGSISLWSGLHFAPQTSTRMLAQNTHLKRLANYIFGMGTQLREAPTTRSFRPS